MAMTRYNRILHIWKKLKRKKVNLRIKENKIKKSY